MSVYTETVAPVEAVTIAEYDIPERNFPEFEREIASLNKHAARIGCPLVTIETLGTEVRKVQIGWRSDATGLPCAEGPLAHPVYADYLYLRVRVTGEEPKFAGWTFAAVLEPTEAGTLVRSIPGVELPPDYQTTDPTRCDHCGKRRHRAETFVLMHDGKADAVSPTHGAHASAFPDGHCIQVGRTCMQDFTGGLDPHQIASLAEKLFKIASGGFGFGHGEHVHDLSEYLAYVCAAVREHGYRSGAQARDGEGPSTATQAGHQMRLDRHETTRHEWDEHWTVTAADTDAAALLVTEARAELAAVEKPNDYQHNLGVLVRLDYVREKDEGFVASIYGYLKRLHERRAAVAAEEKRASERSNEWIGTVGKRETFTLTFMGYRSFYGQFGDRYLNRWEDPTGNAVNWWTGTSDDYTEGATYTVKATVKSHDEYKGRKQTIISRAVVTEVTK